MLFYLLARFLQNCRDAYGECSVLVEISPSNMFLTIMCLASFWPLLNISINVDVCCHHETFNNNFEIENVFQPFSLMGPHWGWKLVTRVCVTDLSETNFF